MAGPAHDSSQAAFTGTVVSAWASTVFGSLTVSTPLAKVASILSRKTDIRVIQVLLGHRKLDTTAVYTRVALKTLREVESPLSLLTPPPL